MFFYSESDSGASGGGASLADWSNFTEAKLLPNDGQYSDYFGSSISISQDGLTVVTGAPQSDPNGVSTAGSAYILQNINGTWTQTKITASDKQADDYFGQSVSISADGSTVAVGAYPEDPAGISNAGSVYVFQNVNGTWTEVQKLTASDKEAGDIFGWSISISGDGSIMIVGARAEDPAGISNAGAAYVFQNINGTWTEVQKLTASDKEDSDHFGHSVSISADGSTVTMGAFIEDPNGISSAGSVYVFKNINGTWTEVQKLTASDKQASDMFGMSVSINGDGSKIAVVGNNKNYFYVFYNTNGSWVESKLLTSTGQIVQGTISISEDGLTVVAGAQIENIDGVSKAGAAYVFQNINGTWTEVQKLTASDKEDNDRFGRSVAVNSNGSVIAIGSINEDSVAVNCGAAYVFQGT